MIFFTLVILFLEKKNKILPIGKLGGIIFGITILFFLIIYPVIYFKLEKLKTKKILTYYIVFQFFTFAGIVTIPFSSVVWIWDWKYFLSILIILNIFTKKYFKSKIVLSFLGHIYIIFYSFMCNLALIIPFVSYNSIKLLSIFFTIAIIFICVSEFYYKKKYEKEELIKINKIMYFWYVQLLIFFTIVAYYYK